MDNIAMEPSSAADMREMIQILFGFNHLRWNEKFPEHVGVLKDKKWGSPVLDKIIKLGWTFGIVQYGIDIWLGPLVLGGGTLDFTQCDERVPEMLRLLPPDATAILPISSYNWSRLDAVLEYFGKQGWLAERQWAVFHTNIADEPRFGNGIIENNKQYLNFKSMYPDIQWITTDTRLPVMPGHMFTGANILLGDIIIPYMYHHIFELYKYTKDDNWSYMFWKWVHSWGETGFYLSGSFEDDTNPFGCSYYHKVMSEQFDETQPMFVPTPADKFEQTKQWIRNQGGKYFLHWDVVDWFDADDKGNPVAKLALRQLILEV